MKEIKTYGELANEILKIQYLLQENNNDLLLDDINNNNNKLKLLEKQYGADIVLKCNKMIKKIKYFTQKITEIILFKYSSSVPYSVINVYLTMLQEQKEELDKEIEK